MANVTNPAQPVPLLTAAGHFQVSVQTVKNWITKLYVRGYVDAEGTVLVDLHEIEQALLTNPRMRDGRRSRFGGAPLVPLPVKVEAIIEGGDAK